MSSLREERGTVLVVDDTPANIAVLLEYLDREGFTVLVARDGESALEQAYYEFRACLCPMGEVVWY